jgi:uncharacterized protein
VTDKPKTGEVEQRSAPDAELKVEGNTLHGLIPYNAKSKPIGGQFVETIKPGAFANTDMGDLILTVNHDHSGVPLGRFDTTLKVEDREDGLAWSCDLPDSPGGQDVKKAVERGDLRANSWRMVVKSDEWLGGARNIKAVARLEDVSVVTLPAYPDARVELREEQTETEKETTPVEGGDTQKEETPMDKEDRENRGGGGLEVEDRTVPAEAADVEERIFTQMRTVKNGESRSLTHSTVEPVEPPQLAGYVWDRLRDQSVFLRSGVPVITTDRKEITFPTLTGDVEVDYYGELEAITPDDPTLSEIAIEPKAIKGLVRMSAEALEDSDPDLMSIVTQNLTTSMSLKFDEQAIKGKKSATEFAGLLELEGTQSLDMANKAFENYDPFVAAVGLLASKNVPGPYVAIMNPLVATSIARIRESVDGEKDSNLLLPAPEGLPAFFTSNLVPIKAKAGEVPATSSVIVFAPSQLAVVSRKSTTIEVDRSEEFSTDAVLVRGKARASLGTAHPESIVVIKNVKTDAITL